jgi:hypothetical protein
LEGGTLAQLARQTGRNKIVRKYILIAIFLASEPALSQEAKPFTFTVTPQELGVIAQALGSMPYREAAPVLHKLEAQLREQQAKPAAPGAPVEPEK